MPAPQLNDFLKSINYEKTNLLEDPETSDENEKAYLPYIVNRCLSYFPDTLFMVQEMNTVPFLDKKLQYQYLLNIIRPRKRFHKWEKADVGDDIAVVKEYYGYSNSKAKEALKILTSEQLEYLKIRLNKGGKGKGK